MAHDGPSSLPTFYRGEKTPEGRLVRRSVALEDEDEVMATSQSPPPMSEQKPPIPARESAFGPEPPSSGGRGAGTTRWSLDDARREEYWKGYWDRKRQEKEIERERERESHWYPDYRGPMRFIEYPEDEAEKGQSRASVSLPRSASKKEARYTMPVRPTTATRLRRSFEVAEAIPPKRGETEFGDEYAPNDNMYPPEGRPRTRKRVLTPTSPPRMPRYKPSFDAASVSMRLPFLSWMGSTLKSRMYCLLPSLRPRWTHH